MRNAVTLVELLVALVILGLVLGVVGVAPRNRAPEVLPNQLTSSVASLRDSALRFGHPVSAVVTADDGQQVLLTAFPDGQVETSLTNVAPLDGEVTGDVH